MNFYSTFSRPAFALAVTVAWLAACGAFALFPGIDQTLSTAAFFPEPCQTTAKAVCGSFRLAESPALAGLRQVLHVMPGIIVAVLAIILLLRLRVDRRMRDQSARVMAAIIAAFALGPGLVVNGILKAYWGRPRPRAAEMFGGDLPFIPAGTWSDACQSNCSFVSGEASGAAVLVLLIALLPASRRLAAGLVLVPIALFATFLRVAFGAHWFSDAVLGLALTFVVFAWSAVLIERILARMES